MPEVVAPCVPNSARCTSVPMTLSSSAAIEEFSTWYVVSRSHSVAFEGIHCPDANWNRQGSHTERKKQSQARQRSTVRTHTHISALLFFDSSSAHCSAACTAAVRTERLLAVPG